MATATEQTKKTTRSAQVTAEEAADTARVAAEEAQHSLRTILRNSAYATVGAGDLAVSVLRDLNKKAAEVRAEAPDQVKAQVDVRQFPARIEAGVERVRDDATREFDRLSARGRELVESIQRSSTTRKAFDQIGTARSQVKAAATSVTRAGKLAGDAVEESAEKIGDDDAIDYDAKTLEELKEIARELDISGRSSMNRDELVQAIKNQ